MTVVDVEVRTFSVKDCANQAAVANEPYGCCINYAELTLMHWSKCLRDAQGGAGSVSDTGDFRINSIIMKCIMKALFLIGRLPFCGRRYVRIPSKPKTIQPLNHIIVFLLPTFN